MAGRAAGWARRAALGAVRRAGRIGLWAVGSLAVVAVGTAAYEYAAGWRSAAEDRALVSEGRALYEAHCAVCHGERLEGRVFESGMAPPPLRKPGFAFWFYVMPRDMEGFLAGLIGEGRGLMPPMGQVLSAAQRRSLAAFIHRANTGTPP